MVTMFTGPLPEALFPSGNEAIPDQDVVSTLPTVSRNGQTKPITLAAKGGAYAIWTESQIEFGDGLMSADARRADILFAYRPAGGDWEPAIRDQRRWARFPLEPSARRGSPRGMRIRPG